jgi:hypothetical protein
MTVEIVAGSPPVQVGFGRYAIEYLFELSTIAETQGFDWRECRYRQLDTDERAVWEPVPPGPGAMLRQPGHVTLRPQ